MHKKKLEMIRTIEMGKLKNKLNRNQQEEEKIEQPNNK
jgi:hypothetical protein